MTGAPYDRTIAVHRLRTVMSGGDVIGDAGYTGAEQSTSSAQGEEVLITGISCSIQSNAAGRKKAGALATDAVFAPTWRILIPMFAVSGPFEVRDRDVLVDDEGYRYEVGQAYWNFMGCKITAIRLEA